MRFEYLIYPEALKILNETEIVERVEALTKSEEGLPYLGGSVIQSDIINAVKFLKGEGFYKTFPKDVKKEYKKLDDVFQNPENFFWEVQRPEGLVKEPCCLEDFRLFTGDYASYVLKPDEIWDYQKFGFSSPMELVSIVGAYVQKVSRGINFSEGYKWTKKREDGSEIVNEITGNMYCDLVIEQTDIAPYSTKDPFGNEIRMRPKIRADRNWIVAYHSVEAVLFVGIMKYIEQLNIPVDYTKDEAKQLIKWGKSLGQGGGTCTEHLGGFDERPFNLFCCYDIPIPTLNEDNETKDVRNVSPYSIITDGAGMYSVYISHNGKLVLTHSGRNEQLITKKKISAKFSPDEAEHLIKGLIYQSAKGLGRTSAKQLLDILEYKHSPKFQEDTLEFAKFKQEH